MRVNRKDFMIRMSLFLLLFICTLFYDIKIFSYISLATFFLFMYMMLTRMPHFMITYFVYVVASSGLIIGCALSEFVNTYWPEFGDWGHFNGSLPLLIMMYVLFFLAIAFFDRLHEHRSQNTAPHIQKEHYPAICHYVSLICVTILLVLFLRIASHPAFLMGLSRGEYAKEFATRSGILKTIDTNIYILAVFILMDYMNGHKITGKIGIALYFLYFLWSGHKFGVFLEFAIIVTFVYHDKFLKIDRKKLSKIIRNFFAAMLILLSLTSLLAVNMNSKRINMENMTDYFVLRAAAQGGLWWKTFEITDRTHLDEIGDEIKGMYEYPAHPENYVNYGMYKMMYLCINHENKIEYIHWAIDQGYVLTEAACGSSYYYLGAAGVLIFIMFHAAAISLVFNALFSALRRKKVFRIIVLTRMYALTRRSLFSLEYFGLYFGLLSIIGYVILIVGKMQDNMEKRKFRQTEDKTYHAMTKQP